MTVRPVARRESSALSSAHCGALAADLNVLVGGQVCGAHLDADSGADTQPLALLGAGLCLERLALRALDGCLGQHGVTEESTAARFDAGQRLAVVDHPREAQVITGLPGDPRDVTAAGLVER